MNLKHILNIGFLLLALSGLQAQDAVSGPADLPFQRGETAKYRVFYDSWLTSWVTAGYGYISITDERKMINGRPTFHFEVIGKSAGLFNLFYKVNDRFESYTDEEKLIPYHFKRRTREGSYRYEDDVDFDHNKGLAKSRRAVKRVPPGIQDIVSAFYYMRTLEFSGIQEGHEYSLDFFLDDSAYVSKIIFLGREVVETRLGKFNCMKFKPMVAQGEIFQEPYPMTIWVTDDRNKAPVLIKSTVIIGSVTIELIEVDGLKYPMESQTD